MVFTMRTVLEIPEECDIRNTIRIFVFETVPRRRVKELAHLLALSSVFKKINVCFQIFAVVIPIEKIYKAYAYYTLALPIVVRKILKELKDIKQYVLNVLIVNDIIPYIYALAFSLLGKILRMQTFIVHSIWYYPPRSKYRFFKPLILLASRLSRGVLAPSIKAVAFCRNWVKRIFYWPIYIRVPYALKRLGVRDRTKVSNYVQDLITKLRKRNGIIFLYLGRLLPVKGIDWLLESFDRLVGICPNAYLIIVGDGILKDTVVERTKRNPNIVFLGWLDSPLKDYVITLSDVGLYTSIIYKDKYFEEYGIVPLEYAMYAKPIIVSSHVGSAHDIVKDGVNGFIVKPGNIEALVNAMYMYCKNRNLIKEHGQRSIEIYRRRFSPTVIVVRLLKIILKSLH